MLRQQIIPITINPMELDRDESHHVLEKKLLAHILEKKKGNGFIPRTHRVILDDNRYLVTLTHKISRRNARKQKNEGKNQNSVMPSFTYDVWGEEIGRGGQGIVCISRRNFKLQDQTIVFKEENKQKIRAVKIDHTKDNIDFFILKNKAQERYKRLKQVGYLHIKPPVVDDVHKAILTTSRLFKGYDLANFIIKLHMGEITLSENKLIELLINLCTKLEKQVHRYGLIHRDVKPENIIINPETLRVKYIDFDLSIEANMPDQNLVGTFEFLAPELFDDTPTASIASDIYALGVSIKELLGLPVRHESFNLAQMSSNERSEFIQQVLDEALHHDLAELGSIINLSQPIKEKLTPIVASMLATNPKSRVLQTTIKDLKKIQTDLTASTQKNNPAKEKLTPIVASMPTIKDLKKIQTDLAASSTPATKPNTPTLYSLFEQIQQIAQSVLSFFPFFAPVALAYVVDDATTQTAKYIAEENRAKQGVSPQGFFSRPKKAPASESPAAPAPSQSNSGLNV